MISDLEQPLPEPHPNILRYEKLRMLMGMNVRKARYTVEQLADVARYSISGPYEFDRYLDQVTTPEAIRDILGITK